MAKEEEHKQEGGGEPPSETILETKALERDPDEAVFAEEAIQSYATEALELFRANCETALDSVAAWVDSRPDRDAMVSGGLTHKMGEAFLHQMVKACHGHKSAIGAVAFRELDSVVDQAVRNEADPSLFLQALKFGAQDLAWFLRDNLQAVISHHWDHVRDLAYEGSRDFVPALHAIGLPRLDWAPTRLQDSLMAVGEHLAHKHPKTQEEALEKDPAAEEKATEQVLLEQDEKAQQAS